MSSDRTFTLAEASRQLGTTPETLRAWVAEGLIRSVRDPRGAHRFSSDEIERARSALGFTQPCGRPR